MNALKMKNEIMHLYRKHNRDLNYLFDLGLNLFTASFGAMYGKEALDKLEKCIIECLKDYADIEELPAP